MTEPAPDIDAAPATVAEPAQKATHISEADAWRLRYLSERAQRLAGDMRALQSAIDSHNEENRAAWVEYSARYGYSLETDAVDVETRAIRRAGE